MIPFGNRKLVLESDLRRRDALALPLGLLGFETLASLSAGAAEPGFGLTIPVSRPRIWFTPERLAAAKKWYSRNRPQVRRDDYIGHAFRYLMTGDRTAARTAIAAANSVKCDVSRTSSNEARWFGEAAILVFDWTYNEFSEAEREAFVSRWNGYLEALRHKQWGGAEMPQSNYFWGYLRNELEWAIATYHENPAARTFLSHALKTRWEQSFVPHANGAGRGGVPLEGSQYGRYLLQYSSIPLASAHQLGRPMWNETPYFRDALYWLLYATTPAPTVSRLGGKGRFETFPMGDDQFFANGGSAECAEYGTFASVFITTFPNSPAAEYARQWLKSTGAMRPGFVAAAEPAGPERPFQTLPLDFYAPGPQHLFLRSSWERDATVVHLQLGAVSGGSHEHADQGSWQIWRKGRWLSRESTGYSNRMVGYGGEGEIAAYHGPAHNTVLLNGKGIADGDRNGKPVMRRLEVRPAFAYAAVDLTPSYRNDQTAKRHHRERDNAVAASVEREFVFLRALEALVIFDRVRSNGNAGPAEEVRKSFLAHFEQAPQVNAADNSVLGVNGDQALRLHTLFPSQTVRRVVVEGEPVGQHRLEVETKGAEQSYFVHIAHAKGASDPDLKAKAVESADGFTVTVEHPQRGFARVVFRKDPKAAPGVAYSRTQMPASATSVLNRVQEMKMTDQGPVWEKLPG